MNLFALLLGAAAIAYGVAKYFRLPSVPVLIATGMVLSLAGWVPSELSIGNGAGSMNMLELGLVFLVFSSGVEFNPKRFTKYRKAVVWVAAVQFILAMGIGILFAKLMGVKTLEAVYLGGGLAASSTLVVL
jgi:CPA2 family monovalent cation:H+ antiporter-2